MKILKKFGWFIVSLLPAALCLLLQIGCAVVLLFIYTLQELARQQGGTLSTDEIINFALSIYIENAIYSVVLYHVIGLLVFGIWYYFAYGRKKRPLGTEKPNIWKAATIIWLGICIQIFTSCILNLLLELAPNLLHKYMELMEVAGLADLNVLSFVAAVILAPIGEELLCRGIIFRLAGKVSSRFWIANIIQAFAFGLVHGNLVQGTYAFFMGLALGYIYGKYRRIWLCMLLHCAINGSSIFLDYYFSLYPEEYNIAVLIGHFVISLLFMVLCFKLLGKRRPLADETEANTSILPE
ncbi:MAG: CPBP family intramembrane metalloprotease [Lachnospiraceae bacterium]|nr:CPBP family intramembrane metalloprotease [Lachnospiraceae bacterium]